MPLRPHPSVVEEIAFRVIEYSSASPVSGAILRVPDGEALRELHTGEDGLASTSVARSLDGRRVEVEADGYFHRRILVRGTLTEIELFPVRRMRGFVRDSVTLQPIPGATVAMEHSRCNGCSADRVTSDADGRYELLAFAGRGDIRVHASAEGYCSRVLEIGRRRIEAAERLPVDLELERGVPVHGIVLDLGTGQPLPDVLVGERLPTGVPVPKTDANGRFIAHLHRNAYDESVSLRLSKPGYCGLMARLAPDDLRGPDPISFSLPRSAPVAGTVRSIDGRPVPFASIEVEPNLLYDPKSPLQECLRAGWHLTAEHYRLTATTDTEGRFRTAAGLIPWMDNCSVRVVAPGYVKSPGTLPEAGAPGEVATTDFELQPLGPCGVITGRVLINGRDAPGPTYVTWRGPTRSGGVHVYSGLYKIPSAEVGSVELAVELRPLFGGDVVALRDHSADAEAVVNLSSGESRHQDFRLAVDTGRISGRVVRESGDPVPRARVRAKSNGIHTKTIADESGRFDVEVFDLGRPFTVTAERGGRMDVRKGVAIGSAGVELLLDSVFTLRLNAVAADTGEQIPAIELAMQRPTGEWVFGARYELLEGEPLELTLVEEPLSAWVSAESAGYARTRVDLAPFANQLLEVMVPLRRVDPVTLVLSPPLPDRVRAVVLLESEYEGDFELDTHMGEDSWSMQSHLVPIWENRALRFGEAGSVTIDGLRPGTYRLLGVRGISFSPASFDISARRDTPIAVTWHPVAEAPAAPEQREPPGEIFSLDDF